MNEKLCAALTRHRFCGGKPYIARNYYDCHGNYVGCSEDFDLDAVLENAYVEVVAHG